MREDVKKEWVEALRSGNYEQGTEFLAKVENDGSISFCCLGVLCDIAVKNQIIPAPEVITQDFCGATVYSFDGAEGDLPAAVMDWAQIKYTNPAVNDFDGVPQFLSSLNDSGRGFHTIAELIERDL